MKMKFVGTIVFYVCGAVLLYKPIEIDAITPSIRVNRKEYDILEINAENKDEVLHFLRGTFFIDEPLNKYLGLVTDENPICEDLEKFAMKDLDSGLNLKAIHNGKIIGVCLNELLERDRLDKEDDLKFTDPKFLKIIRMIDQVTKAADVFGRFPDHDKAVSVKVVSVDRAYRGQGIAKELIKKTRKMGKKLGAGFIIAESSSHFMALALEKLGFELVYSLKYADYKEDGEIVFKPEPPHDAMAIHVLKI